MPKSLFTESMEILSIDSVNNWQNMIYGLFFLAECGILRVQGHGTIK